MSKSIASVPSYSAPSTTATARFREVKRSPLPSRSGSNAVGGNMWTPVGRGKVEVVGTFADSGRVEKFMAVRLESGARVYLKVVDVKRRTI